MTNSNKSPARAGIKAREKAGYNHMTHKEKYNIYCDMLNKSFELCERIRAAFNTEYSRQRNYKLYGTFIAVNSEEERLYFIDIEYHRVQYTRLYKVVTEAALMQFVERLEKENGVLKNVNDI